MEEPPIIQAITISLISNQIKSLQLDIYSKDDEMIANSTIYSHTQTTLEIHSALASFNCLIYN